MTTPTPSLTAPDGAFTIGGGEWNYGQNMTESIGKSLFMLPEPSPENILDILRIALERLPLDALKIFQPILGLAEDIFTNVGGAVAAIIDNLITKPLMATLETLGEWFTAILQTLFPWVPWAELPEKVEDLLQWFSDSLHAIPFFGDFLEGAETFIQALIRNIVHWITHPGEILTALVDAIKDMLGQGGALVQSFIDMVVGWITNGGAFIDAMLNKIVYWFTHPGDFLNALVLAIKEMFDIGGAVVATMIDTLVHWMQNAGDFLTGLINAVINWLKTVGIDLTGPISFMQLIIDNVAKALGATGETITQWAAGLVTQSGLPALVQSIFTTIGSIFPVSWINTQERVNLLNMGVFQSSSTLEESNGWSWDSSKNRTGTTGGSAKLNCSSTTGTRTLYSNQNIKVASGDRIAVSAFVNTLSFNGSATSIQLLAIPFVGTQVQTEVLLASRGASNNAWIELTNSNTPWEIPASTTNQITSIQLALRVNSSATTGSVWWDDITLWKTGLMKQGLVEYLISAWNGLIGGLGVASGATASSANLNDPWNFTLQAGAGAKGTANSAASAAAAASGAAATADGKAVAAAGAAATADGKAVTADGKAVTADGKAVAAQGSANTATTNAATADGKAVTADNFATLAASANNLVLDPDFTDVSVRRQTNPYYTYTYTTEQAISGNALRVVASNNWFAVALAPIKLDGNPTMYPCVPGQVYKYDCYVQAKSTNSANSSVSIQFSIFTRNGSLYTAFPTVISTTKGTWHRITGTYTIPNNMAGGSDVNYEPYTLTPVIRVENTAVGDVHYMDRCLFYR